MVGLACAAVGAAPAAGQLDPTALRAFVESVPADTFCATYYFAPVCQALTTAGPDFVKRTPAGLVCAFGELDGPVCGENKALTERVRVLEAATDVARIRLAGARATQRENARLRAAARRSIAARINALPSDAVWPLVAVIAQRLARAGSPYSSSRYVNNDSFSDFTSWTITRSVFKG